MKRSLKQLHRFFYLLNVAIVFFILYPFLVFYSKKEKYYNRLNTIRKYNSFLPAFLSGIRYKFVYKADIDWSKTYIICPNHASNLDIFSMSLIPKKDFFYMGKKELQDTIFFKNYFNSIDIPVDRGSKISAYRAFKKTEERLKQGYSLIIFPEGLIGEDYPPVLHDFKSGPFKLAIDNKIPIIPVSIVNNWKLMWDDGSKYGSKPGKSTIIFHEVIETKNLSEKDEENLKNNVYEIVHSALNYNKAKKHISNNENSLV